MKFVNNFLNNGKEKFAILLDQLQITDRNILEEIRDGEIKKVVVNKSQSTWQFHLNFPNYISNDTKDFLSIHLAKAFSHIAKTEMHVTCPAQQVNEPIEESFDAFLNSLDMGNQLVEPAIVDHTFGEPPVEQPVFMDVNPFEMESSRGQAEPASISNVEQIEMAKPQVENPHVEQNTPSDEVEPQIFVSSNPTGIWPEIIEEIKSDLPSSLYFTLCDQEPDFMNNELVITLHSAFEMNQFKQHGEAAMLDAYARKGVAGITIDTVLDLEALENHKKEFEASIQKQDQEAGKKAASSITEVKAKSPGKTVVEGPVVIGKPTNPKDIVMLETVIDENRVSVEGYVFFVEIRELRSGKKMIQFKITDYTDSITVKKFERDESDRAMFDKIKKGMWLRVTGNAEIDTFNKFNQELQIMAQSISEVKKEMRQDTAPEGEKRVELHTHTTMSTMDSATSASAYVSRAKAWGHQAIAITDHAALQAFPDAYWAGKKNDIKVIFGLEANLVDEGVPITYNESERNLESATYVVFDYETTGLSAMQNVIIECGAVKIRDGEIIDRFSEFSNPHHKLSPTIIELTGITDDMVENAQEVSELTLKFKEWVGDAILVAHNAAFDMAFYNAALQKMGLPKAINPVIDTIELARFLYPDFKRYGLSSLAKKLGITLTQHHRAVYDAEATAGILQVMLRELKNRKITKFNELNEKVSKEDAFKNARPMHCTILVQNEMGLKNLFKLVTLSSTAYFHRVPRIPRSVLEEHREGLLIGSGCSKGEVFNGITSKPLDDVYKIAEFYDYLEINPKAVYAPLIERENIPGYGALEEIFKNIIKIGDDLGKPVVVTGNAHYIDPHEKVYREVLVGSMEGANEINRATHPDVHFRTTDDLLEEFNFLGEEKAKEIVVTNTNLIADKIENVKVIKDDLYTPKIEGSDEECTNLTYDMARSIYGEDLPEIVAARIEKELKSILGYGFGVIYLISAKLVKKSLADGYLVGSRGSVGSSLVATFMEITEVNPLPPHYVCPECKHSEFIEDGSYASGFDLPDKDCTECGTKYKKDGQDIPFETFLGFKGDKVPDIDLNFSGEYQPQAHDYTKVLFGEDYVFRAGTIGTVAEKTAFGYVKGYLERTNQEKRSAEVERLAQGSTGAKRTTGQHPGGIIVIPDYMDVYDFTPVQFPADNQESTWKTTHFDFHSIHDNVLKLDILGHDDPTMIRMLQDLSGIDPKTIPLDDQKVMGIFGSPEPLGVTEEDIWCKTGTLGVPEFGTSFVRQMLESTKPSTFSELVQISGLSHGTDVWLGNAADLIANGTCVLKNVIGCRDDIMVFLQYQGLEPSLAFNIMESVRKGKGLTEEMEAEMKAKSVPNWYIDSCKKIKYMFPKAHAAAYVTMAVRIAYFKVHMPLFYYAAYFSVRASDFDIDVMSKGALSIQARLKELMDLGNSISVKEKSLMTVLELANEMHQRGFTIAKVDLNKSDAKNFIIEGNSLIPPFNSISGLGDNVAEAIVKARSEAEFLSKEDLQIRGRVSKTLIEFMTNHGCLNDLPDQNQLSFFDF